MSKKVSAQLPQLVQEALAQAKGREILQLDVRAFPVPVDYMILVSGTSAPHVRALARRVEKAVLKHGIRPRGMEGLAEGEWLLLDLDMLLVHIMQPEVRAFYDLEGLWQPHPEEPAKQDG